MMLPETRKRLQLSYCVQIVRCKLPATTPHHHLRPRQFTWELGVVTFVQVEHRAPESSHQFLPPMKTKCSKKVTMQATVQVL